ncbi:MAG TPA: helix-turn-helix domain-containing protein [Streptosporangiaceae bacterium]|nr:helix-turn-helix domain-containing protein [Streptosporangiaceae bacterium]
MSTPRDRAAVPGPVRADARRNRELLLAAALAAFTEAGADDTSLEEIARRAGVGIGTLYRHFPGRQALLEAVYTDQVAALCRQASDLLAAGSPGAALATWLRAMVEFGATKRTLTAALTADYGKNTPVFSASRDDLLAAATALLTRAQQAGAVRPEVQPMDLLRLTHAVAVAVERAGDGQDQAGRLLSLMLDGLLVPAS